LQDAKIYGIDEPYHEKEQMAPPVVRQAATPSASSEGAGIQEKSSIMIQ
jgi:hypothetical protein